MPRFTNPYTFVPLGRPLAETFKRERDACRLGDDLLTGVIRCSLTTKKKTIVPAVERGAGGLLPFFQLPYGPDGGELPAIPGSSIRGVIRGVYESLTHSCMRPNKAHDERLASVGGLKRPGLLYFDKASGKYVLCQAQRYKILNEERLATGRETGDVVDFAWRTPRGKSKDKTHVVTKITRVYSIGSKAYSPDEVAVGKKSNRGVFLRVNKLNNSHPSVFVGKGVFDEDVGKAFVDALKDNARRYKENNKGSAESKAYLKCLSGMQEGTCALPVWYAHQTIEGKEHYQFSYAQLSRVVYAKTVNDLYGQQGVQPCTTEDSLCPACSLFGFVSPLEGNESARASRVRFGDATLLPEDAASWSGFEGYSSWLPELLEPRVSSFEFYLRNTETPHVFTPELPATELAGRKFYWHHNAEEQMAAKSIESKEKNEVLNCEAEYVPEGTHFGFNVYVDGVTRRQLNELVYALTLGEYWDEGKGTHCHKIGRGKPYGYGSVHVGVTDVLVRALSEDSYAVTSAHDVGGIIMDKTEVEGGLTNVTAIRNVTLLGAGGGHVAYPRAGKENTIFKWFFDNRELFKKTRGLPGYKSTLPHVPSEIELDATRINRTQTLFTTPCINNNLLIEEASRIDSKSEDPEQGQQQEHSAAQQEQPAKGSTRFKGMIRNATPGKNPHWFGHISREGQEDIFFHTSRSPQLDLKGLSIKRGMRVTFAIGKSTVPGKNYGTPIAIDIRFE